jgi:hypothetical protein
VPTSVTAPLVSGQNQANAASVSQTITGTISLQAQNGVGPGTVNPPGLSSPARGPERIRELMRSKIVSTRVIAGPDGSTGDLELLGGFWDDLLNFVEDIFHAIENAVINVVNVVVTDTIQITLAIASLGQAAVTLAVQTIHDVENAFITAFRWVEAQVERAIDWLKELFDWTDIVNAGKVLARVISQFLTAGLAYVQPVGSGPSPLQAYVDKQFANWTAQVNQALASLSGNSQPMSQYQPPGSSLEPPDQYNNASANGQARGNFAHQHMQSYVQNGGTVVAQGGNSSALSGLSSAAATTQSQNGSTFQSFGTSLQNAITNPSSLINSAVSDILTILKDVIDGVLKVAQLAVDEILKVAALALSGFQTLLEASLNIPVLTWLFRELTGEPLSLLNLLTLLFAFPATIIYKLLNNNAAPFTQAELTTYLNWTCSFPQLGTSPGAGELLGDSLPQTWYMLYIMLQAFIAYALFDFLLDLMALFQATSVLGTIMSALALVVSAGTLVLGAPWTVFSTIPPWSASQGLYVAIWALGCIALGLNMAFFFFGFNKQLAQSSGPDGQIVVGVVGIAQFVLGLCFLDADLSAKKPNFNGYYYVAETVGPWSTIQKVLYPSVSNPTAAPFYAPVASILDLGCDVVSGVMNAYEDGLLPEFAGAFGMRASEAS